MFACKQGAAGALISLFLFAYAPCASSVRWAPHDFPRSSPTLHSQRLRVGRHPFWSLFHYPCSSVLHPCLVSEILLSRFVILYCFVTMYLARNQQSARQVCSSNFCTRASLHICFEALWCSWSFATPAVCLRYLDTEQELLAVPL